MLIVCTVCVIAQAQTTEGNQIDFLIALARISEELNEWNVDGILAAEATADASALLVSIRDF